MKIGIVAGVLEELKPFNSNLVGTDLKIGHVDLGRHDLFLAWAGTGKVAAAHAATAITMIAGVELLMCVGTAGALAYQPGHTHLILRAFQHDYGVQQQNNTTLYRPGTLPVGPADGIFAMEVEKGLTEQVETLLKEEIDGKLILPSTIATGDIFVQDESYVKGMKGLGADIVDMETAAVAQVATAMGIPWIACKSTTDAASAEGEAEFLANFDAAAERAVELALRVVERF